MNATVNVLCYKSKTLANGEHPLMLRVCKDGKKKYISIGISVNPKYWDFEKGRPKRNCPEREKIENVISTHLKKYQQQILTFQVEDKDYSAQSLITFNHKQVTKKTVKEFYEQLLTSMENDEQLGNWRIYVSSYNSLLKFTKKKLDIYFSDIDVTWLNNYEKWLRKRENKDTTLSIQFRTLRAAYNKAIDEGIVNESYYPFKKYKVSKFDTSTNKRAISKKDIQKIMNIALKGNELNFARDIFVFSYLCGGINFVDIAHLKDSNIVEEQLIYLRQKTGKQIKLKILPEALDIINKYKRSNDYLFPILNDEAYPTKKKKQTRIHYVLDKINQRLKEIAQLINLNVDITTYVARHSFATVLRRSGVNVGIISESLGHTDLKTTQIYLDSFENEQIDEAMSNLL